MVMSTDNKDAHGALKAALPGESMSVGSGSGKTQKLERPVIPGDCTEVQWSFSPNLHIVQIGTGFKAVRTEKKRKKCHPKHTMLGAL